MRRTPDPWYEVRGKDAKTAYTTILVKNAAQNYRNDTTTPPKNEKENVCNAKRVRFNVPHQTNKPQSKWRSKVANRNESKIKQNKHRGEEFELQKVNKKTATKFKNDYFKFIKNGVLNGSIKSVLLDLGASSSTAQSATNYVETGQKSTKEFQSAFGEVQNATDIVKYPFKLREEARRVDIVPTLQNDLMSIGKMADAGYLTIFDNEEVNIYDSHDTTFNVSKNSVLR